MHFALGDRSYGFVEKHAEEGLDDEHSRLQFCH